MADASRSSLRLGVVLVLTVVALFEVLTLLQGVRSTRRLQARATREVARSVETARSRIDARLSQGDRRGWDDVSALVLERGLASEVEVRDPEGASVAPAPGEKVGKGQILAVLTPALGESGSTLAAARAELRNAEQDHTRAKRLFEVEAVSPTA